MRSSLYGSRFDQRLQRINEKLDRLSREKNGGASNAFYAEVSLHWQAYLHALGINGEPDQEIGMMLLDNAMGYLDQDGVFEDAFMQLAEEVKDYYTEEAETEQINETAEKLLSF